MKIGIITDVHIRGKAPVNRIDNFYQSIITKFKEALSIFKKNKCDLILDGGDLIHSPIIALPICDDIIDIIDENEIEYYTIYGNHPMLNAHIENSKATTLAHILKRSKYLKYLPNKYNIYHDVEFIGYEYYHGIEEDIKKNGLYHKEKNKITIAVVHAMITEKKLINKILHVPYKKLKTNYDYIICGHNHLELGIQKVGKTTIIGLGALARLTVEKKDYTRKPKVAVLNTNTGKINVIELKSTKFYKEVFDLDKITQKKNTEMDMDNFVTSLKDIKLQSLDLVGVIKEIAKNKNINKSVINEIIKKIGELENE